MISSIASAQLLAAIEQLKLHEHAGLLYASPAEQFAVVVPFIRLGLERREKCLYIVDDNTPQAVSAALQQGGVELEAASRSGALKIVNKHETFVRQGYFDPEFMLQYWERATEMARAGGFAGLRVAGEMTWALQGHIGSERLGEYLAKLNNAVLQHDLVAIWQYNHRRFSAEQIWEVLQTHPRMITEGTMYKNGFYMPVTTFLGEHRASASVQNALNALSVQERSEQALNRSESSLNAIFENSLQSYVVLDRERKIQMFNRLARENGRRWYGREMRVGDSFYLYISADDTETFNHNFRRALSGEYIRFEKHWRDATGESWLEFYYSPVMEVGGNPSGVLISAVDITEHKHTEKTLRLFQTLVEHSREAIVVCNASGRVLHTNTAYHRLFGHPEAHHPPSDFRTIYPPDMLETINHNVLPTLMEARQWQGELEALDAFGQRLRVWEHAIAIEDADGKVLFGFSLTPEVTARGQAEEAQERLLHDLTERVKELTVLHRAARLFQDNQLSVAEVFAELVVLLPYGWQYSENTEAQITWGKMQATSPHWAAAEWRQTADFVAAQVAGKIEVAYQNLPPTVRGNPFLDEEQTLIDSVADMLRAYLERRQTEATLRLDEARLEALLRFGELTTAASEREIADVALEEAVRLTGSEIGYLHFINPDQASLQLFTWTKAVRQQCYTEEESHYPLEKAGVWVDCVRWRRPVFHNDYQNLPNKKGYPVGHIHLVSHLSVPVIENDTVVAVAGVGNKKEPYDDTDARQLSLFMNSMWAILQRKRIELACRNQAGGGAVTAQTPGTLAEGARATPAIREMLTEAQQTLTQAEQLCAHLHQVVKSLEQLA